MISKAMSKQAQSTYFILEKKWTFLSKKKLLTDQAISKAQKWTFLSKKKY